MRIDETAPLLTAIATPRLDKLLGAWRVGQVLNALVMRVNNVGIATLNVNNATIDVRSELSLRPGTKLLLEVVQTQLQTTLRVIATPEAKDPVAAALRSLVPRQESLVPALNLLAKIAAPAVSTLHTQASLLTSTSPQLRELAKQLIERIGTPPQAATEAGLKQAINNAGPFFERKLAMAAATSASDQAIDADLKGGLLQLVALLKSAIPTMSKNDAPIASVPGATNAPKPATTKLATPLTEMLPQFAALARDADAALARVTMHQLLSLPEHEADLPQWIFELPLRTGERIDIFHFHIFREKHPRDPKHPPAWCVRLSFDLVALGPVGVLVTLLGGTVSISIWAQHAATTQLFQAHLAELSTELTRAGVPLSRVHCECGKAPFSADTAIMNKNNRLIDEHA